MNKNNFWFICLSMLSLTAFVIPLSHTSAETILFHDDQYILGKIIEKNDSFIIIQTDKDKIVIKQSLIKGIYPDSEAGRIDDEARKKSEDSKKNKSKEQVKKQIKKELEKSLSREAAKPGMQWNWLPRTPGWLIGRSAVLPGWGQTEAGLTSGITLTSAAVGGALLIGSLNEAAKKETAEYNKKVMENTILTIVPGPYSLTERLAAGYIMNDSLGGPCGPAHVRLRYAGISYSGLYVGQLIHMAWKLRGFIASSQKKEKTIAWEFSLNPAMIQANQFENQGSLIFKIHF